MMIRLTDAYTEHALYFRADAITALARSWDECTTLWVGISSWTVSETQEQILEMIESSK